MMKSSAREPGRFDGWWLGAALLAWGSFLVGAVGGPVVHPDEDVGIATARLLFRGVPFPDLGVPASLGHALLLAPFSAWLDPPSRALQVARGLNVVLFAALGPLIWTLVRRASPALGRAPALAVAAAISLYPPLVLHAHVGMTESALAAGVTLAALLLARSIEQGRAADALGLGLVIGFLPLIHVRGNVPALAAALVLLAWATERLPGRRKVLVCVAVVAALVLASGWWGGAWLARHRPPLAPRVEQGHDPSRVLAGNSTLRLIVDLAGALAAQALYSMTSTLGLVVLGAFAGGREIWSRLVRGAGESSAAVRAFAALTLLGTWLVVGLFANHFSPRGASHAQFLMLGRMTDAVMVPVLIAAWTGGAAPAKRRSAWVWLVTLPIAAVACVALMRPRTSPEGGPSGMNWIDVLGLYPLLARVERIEMAWLVIVVAVGGLVVVAVGRRTTMLAVCLAVAGACAAFVTSRGYFVAGSHYRDQRRVVAHVATLLGERVSDPNARCVAVDDGTALHFTYLDLSFASPGLEVHRFDSASEDPPCPALFVLPGTAPPTRVDGARRVVIENGAGATLWVRPGPFANDLATRGLLLMEPPGSVLPPTAMRSKLTLLDPSANQRVTSRSWPGHVRLRVEHVGTTVPWPSEASFPGPSHAVRLGIRWLRSDRSLAGQDRVPLPETVMPGEAIDLDVPLVPQDQDRGPLARGEYSVWVGLLQENVAWFADRGDSGLELRVLVE